MEKTNTGTFSGFSYKREWKNTCVLCYSSTRKRYMISEIFGLYETFK